MHQAAQNSRRAASVIVGAAAQVEPVRGRDDAPAAAVASASAAPPSVTAQARFATPADYLANPEGTAAVTYDGGSVPVGGRVRVRQWHNKWGGMSVRLRLDGLQPSGRPA
jgi:hypothetical protein